jgi:hypothetical protein
MASIRDYSTTAASNVDLFPENMSPAAVNDSARAVQAELAKLILDEGGSLHLGGTGTAYTLTLNTTPAALTDGLAFSATAITASTGGSTTLVVTPSGGTAFTAKKIKVFQSGVESDPTSASMIANGHYLFQYDSAADSSAGAYILLNPSSAGGDVLLTSGSFAGATAYDLTLPTGYRFFKLFIRNMVPGTTGYYPNIRFSYDSGSSYAATGYSWGLTYMIDTVQTITGPTSSGTLAIPTTEGAIGPTQASGSSSSDVSSFELTISPGDTTYTTVHYRAMGKTSGGYSVVSGFVVAESAATRPTHIRLRYADAVTIPTGSYQLYGLKH